ncbi:hypothetical protein Tco_0094292 [Tanacetum coccineum]
MSGSPERTNVFSRIRRDRSELPKHKSGGKGRRDGGVFNRLGGKGKSVSAHSESLYQSSRSKRTESVPENVTIKERIHGGQKCFPKVKIVEGDTGGQERKNQSQALKRTNYPNHGSDDPKDHLKFFQADAKVECWAMPTWCHMFISTLTGSARRFKAESRHVRGALECMRISEFMHEITNFELNKRLHDNIPKSVDEMMRVTIAFLREEVAASNQVWKKTLPLWKQQETGRK